MSDQSKDITVFLSWQSDSPEETNRNAMRKAIRAAAKAESSKGTLKVSLDEATRKISGSRNIVDAIMEKIGAADVFVADITTVTPPGAGRPCANPNVLFELGYAVAELGWDRIVLLFNKAFGSFPLDLPFDISQNRVGTYTLDGEEHVDPKALDELVLSAIRMVLKADPKRPAQLRGLDAASLKHQKDVESLKWVLSEIWVPALDEHIRNVPDRINDNIFHSWEGFSAVCENSLFHIHDEILSEALNRLLISWRTTLQFYGRYRDVNSGNFHLFHWHDRLSLNSELQSDWDTIKAAGSDMRVALNDVLSRVRDQFVEVNISETNAAAYADMNRV